MQTTHPIAIIQIYLIHLAPQIYKQNFHFNIRNCHFPGNQFRPCHYSIVVQEQPRFMQTKLEIIMMFRLELQKHSQVCCTHTDIQQQLNNKNNVISEAVSKYTNVNMGINTKNKQKHANTKQEQYVE